MKRCMIHQPTGQVHGQPIIDKHQPVSSINQSQRKNLNQPVLADCGSNPSGWSMISFGPMGGSPPDDVGMIVDSICRPRIWRIQLSSDKVIIHQCFCLVTHGTGMFFHINPILGLTSGNGSIKYVHTPPKLSTRDKQYLNGKEQAGLVDNGLAMIH